MYISPINLLWKESPVLEKFEQTAEAKMREIRDTTEKNISDQCIQIAYECGIDINKEDLIAALKADHKRYEEAYSRGYSAGRCDALRELETFKNTGMWEVPDNE